MRVVFDDFNTYCRLQAHGSNNLLYSVIIYSRWGRGADFFFNGNKYKTIKEDEWQERA